MKDRKITRGGERLQNKTVNTGDPRKVIKQKSEMDLMEQNMKPDDQRQTGKITTFINTPNVSKEFHRIWFSWRDLYVPSRGREGM